MAEEHRKIGDQYLEAYGEIPDELIKDPYLAGKKLGGHRRQFSPGDPAELDWFRSKRSVLEQAYGKEKVDKFFKNELNID
jgi:hypothetical protein